MASAILTTGLSPAKFHDILSNGFAQTKPAALAVAVAYVSVPGFLFINGLVKKHRLKECRLVTDTGDAITHPMALKMALNDGWDVRVVDDLPGTFHPKLYVGGSGFGKNSAINDANLVVAGSANLSNAALSRNGECSFVNIGIDGALTASTAWKECWHAGKLLSAKRLATYTTNFGVRNRQRRAEDLITLGVADAFVPTKNGSPPKGISPPLRNQRAIPVTAATVAWAGLQSFTGDYNLQVEFPRDAGAVLSRILANTAQGNSVGLQCEDGQIRHFIFRYYGDNGMFRLNVPNSAPRAAWARTHKRGIAVVAADSDASDIRFEIIPPGREMNGVIQHSLGLGTWGKTTTRLYGWY